MKADSTFQSELTTIGTIPGVMAPGNGPTQPDRDPFEALCEVPIIEDLTDARSGSESLAESWEFVNRPPVLNPPEWLTSVQSIGDRGNACKPVDLTDWIQWESLQNEFDIADWFVDFLGLDVEAILGSIERSGTARATVASAVARFGTDSFGTYLPWHTFANSKRTPWGMYLFLEPLAFWAVDLAAEAKGYGLTIYATDALRLAFYLTYRHELFHYHVERFAIRQEVIQRRAIYRPYEENVFYGKSVANTEDWLEEALAQSVVLESTFVANRLRITMADYRDFLQSQFDRFPDGYKHYRCTKFGGTEAAHALLGAQVVSGQQKPGFALTAKFTPKMEYSSKVEDVPGYIVARRSFISRFQLAMPKKHKWATYAKRRGISFEKPGKGDHERWRVDGTLVTLNFINGECDRNSLRDVAGVLGVSLRQLVEQIRRA